MALELKKTLYEKGIKQNFLARKLSVDQSVFCKWINEKEEIPEDKQKEIVLFLDLPKNFFTKRKGAA